MTATEEKEPLIVASATASTSAASHQRISYDAVAFFDPKRDNHRNGPRTAEPEAVLRMDPILSSNGHKDRSVEPSERITYTWSDVNVYHAKKKDRFWDRFKLLRNKRPVEQKHILKDVCGVAYPGELLVIMGSSGAGKTTLLNTLTFRPARGITVSGMMAANGQRVSPSVLISRTAYVQQDDLFVGTLTVKEHLLFQAMVRMDRNIPYRQRLKRVNEVISELALTKCKNTVIGIPGRVKGLSGGEMKRLSFASEVLTDPPLMFCDEPTSGLDSFMAHQVVSVLKDLTRRGKTIIATLHQPSSELFALFDRILLMAEGRVAFMGTPEQACAFFKSMGAVCPSNYNPADYFVQVLAVVPGREVSCRHAINSVCDAFQRSDHGMKIALEAESINGEFEDSLKDSASKGNRGSSPYKASWCEQFRAVLWRSWISVIKEPILIKVRLLQTLMVSLLIGVIYFGQKLDQDGVMNINGSLFIFLTNMTFQNVFAVISVFCAELPIFLREHRNGMYRTDIYFICKTLAEAPIFVAVPFVFTTVAYPMVGLYPGVEHFFIAAGILVLIANVATSFGYLISCASTNISMALSVGPPVIIPFLLFGGFFLNTASVPPYFKWFSYLSWFRYGNEALLINQWSDVESIACTRSNATCPKTGSMVLQTFNFREEDFWVDIISLVSLIIAFRFLAFLALLSKTLRSKFVYNEVSRSQSPLSAKVSSHERKSRPASSSAISIALVNSVFPCFNSMKLMNKVQRKMLENSPQPRIPRPFDSLGKGVTLSWSDLSVYVMDRGSSVCNQLVNNVRGAVRPGDLTAILGGSGAGKSSLMTALALRTGPGIIVHGDIRINGQIPGPSFMRHCSGFMHQEDIFIGTMTVLEHMWFMARMKLDRRMENWEIRERVDNLLKEVGLSSRRDARIGTGGYDKVLSGGEKKRLAFATELLTDPKILFLDEPTTGQDSHSASVLVSQLTEFARRGRTVLCTIHQPSSAIFDTFHRIILVADGRIAFAGTREQALKFFSRQGYDCPRKYNPADFLVATLAIAPREEDSSRRTAQRICDAFLTSDACRETDVILQLELHMASSYDWRGDIRNLSNFKQIPCWKRLYWLTHRGFMQVLRDPSVQCVRIIQKLCLAIMAGLCFVGAINLDQLGVQAVQGVLFILVSENAFFPMYATLSLIPQELPLFLREHRAGMYPSHLYYFSRIISLLPGLIVEPVLFTMIVYWLAGLRSTIEAFGWTLLVAILTMNVSTACGCFFSAAFDSVPLAMAYLVPFDYILMITMGPFVKLGTLPMVIGWVKYISWLLHSTEALTIVQWKDVHNITCEKEDSELPCLTEGSQVLDRYDFDEKNFWMDITAMAIILTVFHILAYLSLWNRCRSK
ncbi:pleiotropic drug resistance protein TUR2-like [Venturia canescens]|uniref:pleiotropic drug resistance protein TUR2-like n=1 Tax=Venturia canescens TaxID=32260 RepID=UPI001C9C2BE6|nr:pleiotropic drug resistance protein TUR2-like [Venturia canescens]